MCGVKAWEVWVCGVKAWEVWVWSEGLGGVGV